MSATFGSRIAQSPLLSIIQQHVAANSYIHSDEWAAYRGLGRLGYHQETVNHELHYQDPGTEAHKQGIERSWLEANIKIMKTMRGTTGLLMQSHLDEYCYRVKKRMEPVFFYRLPY